MKPVQKSQIKWPKLIGLIVLCELIGSIGSIFTTPAIETWYSSLMKSALNPPNWVFAPAWTILFALMGIALYFVIESKSPLRRIAIIAFGVQFALNVLWSALFFGMHSPFLGLIEICLLWLAVLITTFLFARISKKAGYFMIPYVLWIMFAAYLNYAILILN